MEFHAELGTVVTELDSIRNQVQQELHVLAPISFDRCEPYLVSHRSVNLNKQVLLL